MAIPLAPKQSPPRAKRPTIGLRDRWWWAPLAVVYKVAIRLRHAGFDTGLRRSHQGRLPSVVLGNITVGGTGKTPHVMSLLHALGHHAPGRRWAVLSRGYGRKTKGILEVDREGTAKDFGDESLEVARRFPGTMVAVSEDRLAGISHLADTGKVDAVLLDDGFQHRRLDPTYSIVLVDATQPVDRDHFLPRGRLRDLPERLRAADAVIISRCTDVLTRGDLRLWRHRLDLLPEQLLLHTGTIVDGLRNMHTKRYAGWPRRCIAVSGMAHPAQFEAGLARNCEVVRHFAYPDHHDFTPREAEEWLATLQDDPRRPEAIITTEKDASRIRGLGLSHDVPVLIMGMKVKWWDEDALHTLLTSIEQRVEASLADPDI